MGQKNQKPKTKKKTGNVHMPNTKGDLNYFKAGRI
jgi:hypothetical protein